MKELTGVWVALIVVIVLAFFAVNPLVFTGFFISVSGENATLSVWDVEDPEGGSLNVYADGSQLGSGPSSTAEPTFFANYTNLSSGESINGSGIECNISFNVSGGWSSPSIMWFNSSSLLYVYNSTFSSRGFYYWNVTCDGSSQNFDSLNLTDNITVLNTPAGIYVPLATKNCSEDSICNHNFSQNCYDIDVIDGSNLIYSYVSGTEFTGFSMQSGNGNVTIDINDDSGCGEFKVSFTVQDALGEGAVANKTFIVNAVNDIPVLGTLPSDPSQNSSMYHDLDATDEETPSGPFIFNITFLECYRDFNSEHTNVTNCSGLFTINQTTGVINRTNLFDNTEVGQYRINFTVTDPGNNLTGNVTPPYSFLANQTDSQVVNITVVDLNDLPVIDSVPNQFWTQDENSSLVVNASDIDNGTLVFSAVTLYRNLSTYVNSSLFPIVFNETIYQDNGTSIGNGTMNFTPVYNNLVGNYTVNISVDDGRVNGTVSVLVNFTVLNVNDQPNLTFNCSNYSVEGIEHYCNVGENTTDPDDFASYVPYTDTVNGTITYSINFTYCNKTFNQSDTNCSIFGINQTTGVINYTDPARNDTGNYTVNISVTDGGNLTDSFVFNFTVIDDYPPNITTSVQNQNATQNQSLYLSINATDLDNATDTLTFSSETYSNSTLLNTTLFPIQTNNSYWPPGPAIGVMNYTSLNNSQVGNYTIKIIVNDTWGREDSVLFNLTIYNKNDPPSLNFSCVNSTNEDSEYICNVGENTTDIDTETPYGENLTYNMNFTTGPALFDINSTTGIINFTASNNTWANNSDNFTYVLNISVTDSNNSEDSYEFNLTIHAVNDAPVFNFTNRTAFENSTFFMNLSINATDEENDIPFFYNISFVNCSRQDNSSNCSILNINTSTGVINKTDTFNASEVGNYTINVTVTDAGNTTQPNNATGIQLIDFKVYSTNKAPDVSIAGAIYYYSNGSISPTIYENGTIVFAISVTDTDGDKLNCTWSRNGTVVGTVDNCQGSNSYNYVPDFSESGYWIFRLEASDAYLTSYSEWGVQIMNQNRPPVIYYPVQNQTWNMNTPNKNIILSYNFQDPDNENNVTNDDNNFTLDHTPPANIVVLLDDQSTPVTIAPSNWTGRGVVTLTPTTDWYGVSYITFTLNDSEFNVTSNNITLNVSYQEPTQTIVQTGGGGGVSTSDTKIASLQIDISPFGEIGSYNKTTTEVLLINTGEVALNRLNITSFVEESDEIILSLSRVYVSQLGIGDNITTNLTIETKNLSKDTYEIKVTGIVDDPGFNQSSTIYLKPIYETSRVRDNINLAKDLFQDNPECLDLTELILQAEKELTEDNLARAKELTETALENCRDIIRYTNQSKQKVTPDFEDIPINEITIALLSIALIASLVYLLLGKRAESRRLKQR